MKIEVNGQQVEAYDLLMRKEYAQEIISGKKKVEFRSFSDHYCDRFFDKATVKRNQNNGRHMGDDGFENEFKDVWYIHFHNYNNTWYLDVEISETGMFCVDSQDVEEFARDYPDFADYLPDARENDKLPEDERPMLFYLVIDKVVSTNL